MKPPPFDLHRPESLEAALELRDRHGDEAKLLAGGQSLMPLMNMRLARPRYLIDLNRVAELSYITMQEDRVCIGAMTRQRVIENSAELASRVPLLTDATRHIAYPQIRNQGTIGGSVSHADPAADLLSALIALGAELTLQSTNGGERCVPVQDFLTGYLGTVITPQEILTTVTIPLRTDGPYQYGFAKYARHRGALAIANAAVVVRQSPAGSYRAASVTVGGIGPKPATFDLTNRLTSCTPGDRAALRQAARHAAETVADQVEAEADALVSEEFRRQTCAVVCEQALGQALLREGTELGGAR